MRSAAQILPSSLTVQADRLVRGNGRDDFGLVVLAELFEVCDGGVARQNAAMHLEILGRDLGHALFDGDQVLGRKRPLVREIVIKAILDHRTNGDLRLRIQLLDRVRQKVRRRMANDFEALGIPIGDDTERGVVLDQRRGIHQDAGKLAGQRRFGKSRTNARRDLRHADRVIEVPAAAIGKCYYGHRFILANAGRLGPAPFELGAR